MDAADLEVRRARWRADSAWKTLSLIPFVEAPLLWVFAKSYLSVILGKPPDIVGIPLGVVLEVLVLAWAALGARVIWTTRSPTLASIALLVATAPAVPLVLLLPAIILIMQNVAV
jgi:mannose/fructose/N-acetylgalactosamine-specific phosphotransferase system component IIC